MNSDNISILSLPTSKAQSHHVSPRIHMHPNGPLQHQLLSVRDYSITLGNFLLLADRELNLSLTAHITILVGAPYPVKCHGFKLVHSSLYNSKGRVDISNPQLPESLAALNAHYAK